jgi:hypothetical protein
LHSNFEGNLGILQFKILDTVEQKLSPSSGQLCGVWFFANMETMIVSPQMAFKTTAYQLGSLHVGDDTQLRLTKRGWMHSKDFQVFLSHRSPLSPTQTGNSSFHAHPFILPVAASSAKWGKTKQKKSASICHAAATLESPRTFSEETR